MTKICLILKEIKDNNFNNNEEKINFLIFKALLENSYLVDVFCIKNNLEQNYKNANVKIFDKRDFIKNALLIAENLKYDYTFSADFLPTDVVYINKHSAEFVTRNIKTKLNNFLDLLIKNKEFRQQQIKAYRQKINLEKTKIILAPSTILKNDLINHLAVDGQKTYILTPAVNTAKNFKYINQDVFTFGFFAENFFEDNLFLLLKVLKQLNEFKFKVKIFYKNKKHLSFLNTFLTYLNLNSIVEIITDFDNDNPYSEIDCLLSTSKNEPFGLHIMEAMSKGKIVLISSKCGIKDIIEHDNNGFIFDITKNASNNLRKAMQYIIFNKNEFDNLRQKAMYTASAYNFEKFKTELARILEKEKPSN